MAEDKDSGFDERKKHAPHRESEWGKLPEDHFGYASEEERLKKRGLEDWELVEKMSESQHHIPYWFIALFVLLLVVAVGFTFPLWGNRPDYHRSWFDWGMPGAVVYVTVATFVIYWMVDLRSVRREKKEAAKAKQNGGRDNTKQHADDA